MSKRKHIGLKTKLAATLLRLPGGVPYNDAKQMTEDQIISLYQFDHNIFYESGNPDCDKFWNLRPMLIHEHRTKTKADAKIIAKGRRIRRKLPNKAMIAALDELDAAVSTPKLRTGPDEIGASAYGVLAAAPRPARSRDLDEAVTTGPGDLNHTIRKLRSRGFDKTLRRKMSGKVEKR